MHGGIALKDISQPNPESVTTGCANLIRHVENLAKFGLPVIVAINRFAADSPQEHEAVRAACAAIGVNAILCTHWSDGGQGALALADAVTSLTQTRPANFQPLYDDSLPLAEKISTIATQIYRANNITIDPTAATQLAAFTAAGYGHLPICMAKTQYSFTTDPTLKNAPSNFTIPIREARLAAGAGFIVALCGNILTMPGLPRHPAAEDIFLTPAGEIGGLS
jgi:formate--tetrahydrofolate ligase